MARYVSCTGINEKICMSASSILFFFFFLVARKLRECLVQFFANRFAFLLLLVQYVCKENQ